MSLALTQPGAGLTFNPETIEATAAATMAVGEVVHITDSGLIATSPTEVVVTKQVSAASSCGFYGVVTSEITATSSGRIALSGIHECAHLGSGSNNWAAGTPLTVNAAGQLIPAVDKLIIVAYAMEVVDVDVETTGTGKAFMVGGPAITTASVT
jgi:hypothetical protein